VSRLPKYCQRKTQRKPATVLKFPLNQAAKPRYCATVPGSGRAAWQQAALPRRLSMAC